jgi:hypothetical protein
MLAQRGRRQHTCLGQRNRSPINIKILSVSPSPSMTWGRFGDETFDLHRNFVWTAFGRRRNKCLRRARMTDMNSNPDNPSLLTTFFSRSTSNEMSRGTMPSIALGPHRDNTLSEIPTNPSALSNIFFLPLNWFLPYLTHRINNSPRGFSRISDHKPRLRL